MGNLCYRLSTLATIHPGNGVDTEDYTCLGVDIQAVDGETMEGRRQVHVNQEMIDAGVDVISGFHPDWDDPVQVVRELLEASFAAGVGECTGETHKSVSPHPRTWPRVTVDRQRIWVSLGDQAKGQP